MAKKPETLSNLKERVMKVICSNNSCRTPIEVRNTSAIRAEFSVCCPKCGRRFIYHRMDLK